MRVGGVGTSRGLPFPTTPFLTNPAHPDVLNINTFDPFVCSRDPLFVRDTPGVSTRTQAPLSGPGRYASVTPRHNLNFSVSV